MISSRTPEGESNHCFVCRKDVVVEPSTVPGRDAPCPHCGKLLWFPEPESNAALYVALDWPEFSARLDDWIDRADASKIYLDFTGVRFIGSEVLGKLISLHRKLVTRGLSLGLRNIDKTMIDVFKITKLDTLFDIDES